MNQWATLLRGLPTLAQRAIARHQRISLPRRNDTTIRVARLRAALCRKAAVRACYPTLDAATQAAIQHIAGLYGGISPTALRGLYGDFRPWHALAADPKPCSVAERLLLLGWLLPRAASHRHPLRFIVPYELRVLLPNPTPIATLGAAASAFPAPILAEVITMLLHAAGASIQRSCTTNASLNQPAPRFVQQLLDTLGLIDASQSVPRITLAGQRFLTLEPAEQLQRLRQAWLNSSHADDWLRPLRINLHGIDWPCLRRTLVARIETLPLQEHCDPALIAQQIYERLGPLATAHTHGFRTIRRTPWGPHKEAQVFQAALRGPLAWLGYVAWANEPDSVTVVFRPELVFPAPAAWQYTQPNTLMVPIGTQSAALLELSRYTQHFEPHSGYFQIVFSQHSLARAVAHGGTIAELHALLERHVGPIPAEWHALLTLNSALQISDGVVLTGSAGLLKRISRMRSIRRTKLRRMAHGVAIIPRHQLPALSKTLLRAGIPVQGVVAEPQNREPGTAEPQNRRTAEPTNQPILRVFASPRENKNQEPQLTPGDWAALLAACRFYRQHAAADTPLQLDGVTEQRIASMLPARMREAIDQAVPPTRQPSPNSEPLINVTQPDDPLLLAALQQASTQQRELLVVYDTGGAGNARQRILRPLELEQHGEYLYLQAYCLQRQMERTFRVDRITAYGEL